MTDKKNRTMKRMGFNRRHALVPRNLDMSLFGEKRDKVAAICDLVYRKKIHTNSNGYVKVKQDLTKAVPIHMQRLSGTLHEPAAPIMDLICWSKRHEENGTQPIAEVLIRVRKGIKGKQSALYVLAEQYQVKPKIHRFARTKNPVFKHDPTQEMEMISNMPPVYQKVCKHIKGLSLEMDVEQFEDLKPQIRNNYIHEDRETYIQNRIYNLMTQYPKMSKQDAELKAAAQWERRRDKRIDELDEENYERLLFSEDKVLEMEGIDDMPVYSLDEQGRLHYYLTNMSKELHSYVRLNGCKIMSYDLKTSQPIFIWVALRKYIREHSITIEDIKQQADEIIETIRECGDGTVPDYIQESFEALKRKRSPQVLDDEMAQFGKLLGKDFYEDVMNTLDWERLSNGKFDRDKFKTKVLFPFLYGTKPKWNIRNGQKNMVQYFVKMFPSIYCVIWKMRRFTEICIEDYQIRKNRSMSHKKRKQYIKQKYQTAEFPKEMQRQEARMFYDVIIQQIDQPLVTIHDSILVEAGKKCEVAKIITEAFRDLYQINVRVTCKLWT